MATDRLTKQELKAPDEFIVAGRTAIDWVRSHAQTALLVVGGVVALGVAIGGWFALQESRQQEANAALARALVPWKAGKHAEAAGRFQEVVDGWGSSRAAVLARLYLAEAEVRAGNRGNALTALRAAADQPGLPPYLRQGAQLGLAQTTEQEGDLAAAADLYATTAKGEGPYTATALSAEARLRRALGDVATAAQVEARLKTEFPDAPEARILSARSTLPEM